MVRFASVQRNIKQAARISVAICAQSRPSFRENRSCHRSSALSVIKMGRVTRKERENMLRRERRERERIRSLERGNEAQCNQTGTEKKSERRVGLNSYAFFLPVAVNYNERISGRRADATLANRTRDSRSVGGKTNGKKIPANG